MDDAFLGFWNREMVSLFCSRWMPNGGPPSSIKPEKRPKRLLKDCLCLLSVMVTAVLGAKRTAKGRSEHFFGTILMEG